MHPEPEHPNALFVARVTHKGTCEMIWMLNNPHAAVEYLDGVIALGNEVSNFEYHIGGNSEWKSIEWFLQELNQKKQ